MGGRERKEINNYKVMQILLFCYFRFPLFKKKKGILACLDGYMNIAMEQTEEWVDGQLRNKYGDAFIRGNNGLFYSFIILDLKKKLAKSE